jgi:cathepsin L
MKFLFLVVLFVALAQGYKRTKASDLSLAYTYEAYIEEYGKSYGEPAEYAYRKGIFTQRLRDVLRHNSQVPPASWKMGINQFSDWTDAELKKTRGYKKAIGYGRMRGTTGAHLAPPAPLATTIPASLDWRAVPGILSAIKDQGQCGSCWTFASSSTIESRWAAQFGMLMDVSPQQIASCTSNPDDCGGSGGCEGGVAELAFGSIIKNGGIASEWTYPYVSYNGQDFPCKYGPSNRTTNPAVKIASYVALPTNDYNALITAIQGGPVAITVDASTWNFYESGIYNGCNQVNPSLDHNVQLVGYGTEGTVPYWVIRNSWAPTFGEKGYIRILRDSPARCGIDTNPSQGSGCNNGPTNVTVCGTCGILFDNSYPIIAP